MIAKRLILLLTFSFPAFAMDLGSFGKTYPIVEIPADKLIEKKLQDLTVEQKRHLEKGWIEKTKASVMRPQGSHLPRAIQSNHWLFNPAVHFKEAIIDEQSGKVIIPKNTQVNPLEHVSLNKPLVFFDSDDKAQTEWVKKHHLESTLILVNGEPLKLQEAWKKKIFFDQRGKLQTHFSLKAVPSIVTQEGMLLRIQECALSF